MELSREQVSKAFIGLYHDGASVGQRKTFDILLAHDAALRTKLDEANETMKGAWESIGEKVKRIAELHQRLAQVEQERDSYKAVLAGAEYEQVEKIGTLSCEQAVALGKESAFRTKDLIIKLATAQAQLNSVNSGHHPRCTTVGQVYVCHIECKLQLSNILSSQLGKAQARIRELVQCLDIAQRR